MRTLTVRRFSCINDATLDIYRVTLLVGPQASGKSVLCKLSYFFASLLQDQVRAIVELSPRSEFNRQVKAKFLRWFPYETWGSQKFDLSFSFGPHQIEVARTVSKGKGGKGINVHFSDALNEHYDRSLSFMQEKLAKNRSDLEVSEYSLTSFTTERYIREDLRKTIGEEFVTSQIFIPAARSFFTSVGRAIAAFENSNMLDPLTVLFGKMYSAGTNHRSIDNPEERIIHTILDYAEQSMLGGKLVRERDREVLQTSDGRTIPLSNLSSGQQEIFPLLRVLPRSAPKLFRRLLYVEEPEAHLFPDAQSRLVELLASLSNLYGSSVEMVITTHSPYVLTKFNNLILAGKVGRRRNRSSVTNSIVPQRSWMAEGAVSAYALDNGKLVNLIDSDGLINGDYLDEVSNHIASQFTQLVDAEFVSSKSANVSESNSI